jgi:hypothetical protein
MAKYRGYEDRPRPKSAKWGVSTNSCRDGTLLTKPH